MEKLSLNDKVSSSMVMKSNNTDEVKIKGKYVIQCTDKDGNIKWEDVIDNLVTTVGKNSLLDNFLAGSAFTQVGPFMGLISSVGYSTIVVGDTMASHAGLTEAVLANSPTY